MPIQILLDLPTAITPGQSYTMSSSYTMLDTAAFQTTTPYLTAFLDAAFEIYAGVYAEIDYKLGTYKKNFSAIDLGESFEYSFDTRDLEGYFEFPSSDTSTEITVGGETFDVGYSSGGLVGLGVYTPEIDITSSWTSANTLSGSNSDTFMEGTIDLVGLFNEIASKLPYIGAAFEVFDTLNSGEFSLGKYAGIDWSIFSADFVNEFSLEQNISLVADNMTGYITYENGTTSSTFNLGQSYTFTTPTNADANNDGKVDLKFNFGVSPTLRNQTSIGYDGDIEMAAIEGSAWYDIGVSSGKTSFGPLWSKEANLFSGSAKIYDNSFTLGGFGSQTLTASITKV